MNRKLFLIAISLVFIAIIVFSFNSNNLSENTFTGLTVSNVSTYSDEILIHNSHPTKMSLQGKVEGLLSGNLGVKVGDSNSCSSSIFFDQNFSGAIQNGSFNLLLGETADLNLNYNKDYFMCLYVDGVLVGGPSKFRGGQGQIHSTDVNGSEFASTDLNNNWLGAQTFFQQIKSNVATGTSPFSVLSTTKVNNLQADYLDGFSYPVIKLNAGNVGSRQNFNFVGTFVTAYENVGTNSIDLNFLEESTTMWMKDEFCSSGATSDLGWVSRGNGTAASLNARAGELNHPCIKRFSSGTDSNSLVYLAMGDSNGFYVQNGLAFKVIARLNNLTSGQIARFGFCDVWDTSAECTNGMYFAYEPDSDSNWKAVVVNNGSRSAQAMSAPTGGFQTLSASFSSSKANFNIDGTSFNHTTNLPTGRTTGFFFQIFNTSGSSKSMDVDYVEIWNNSLTR